LFFQVLAALNQYAFLYLSFFDCFPFSLS